MARNKEFGNRIRNWHTQKRPFDLGGFSLCSVKMFIWTAQIMYIWGGGLGGGGYFRNRSLGGRKKVVREKFVNNRKNAHFFTGVNQNKRGGWRGRGRRRKRKRGRGRRSSKRRRRTIPHSNMIISLPYDNFLKSVICLFVTGVIITLQRMPSK